MQFVLVIYHDVRDTMINIFRCFFNDITMLIDTHIHIPLMIAMTSLELTEQDIVLIQELLKEAQQQRVNKMITIGTMYQDSMQNIAIARHFSSVYATVGIHPTEINELTSEHIAVFENILAKKDDVAGTIVGIGECGVDLYHKHATVIQQQDVFRMQIELALRYDLPVVIHSREAADETLRCLDEFKETNLRGIIHCFSYDASIAREFIQRNFVLGIGGTLTYPKNDVLRAIMREVLPHQFVLETDAPFLPPQPWRGKKNHPQYIAYIAEYIAELRVTTPEHIAQTTTHSAQQIFTIIA